MDRMMVMIIVMMLVMTCSMAASMSHVTQDVGIDSAASAPEYTKVLPAASNNFPTLGSFQFGGLGHLGEMTKEQMAAQKEQGFMPGNPFGSSSNLASSNIAPPDTFKNSQSLFGSSSNSFQFPKEFHSEFAGFSGGFGSDKKEEKAPAREQPQREAAESERSEEPRIFEGSKALRRPQGSRRTVDHRPRGQAASSFQPRFAQRRHDFHDESPFGSSGLHAASSKQEEKKNKGKCEIVNKDGMTCEVCNDGHGGFSEHCSHSQNSGKDSKFTNSRRHTSDDLLKPKEAPAAAQAPQHEKAQQRQVTQRQRPSHGSDSRQLAPQDRGVFDYSGPSFDHSPYAQSRQDKVYDTRDPFEGFDSEPYDPFAQGSNSDPYKFEFPKFDDINFDFGTDDQKKAVAESGLQEDRKDSADLRSAPAPASSTRSSSHQNEVPQEKEKTYQAPNSQDNFQQLGKMVDQFGKKNRNNCKKEIRKTMTCYICPNKHGKTDEECMYASKDPHSQHMMYTEESSYGNPQ
ncbi:uncharacterized protein LOC108677582 isoform X2 [Hyalella azteca]|uniref:Uncharacterized protein LOC108677582 isoform X2 n=1 Tax=Hyalella azteca TaxID=294128 RepID=A0A979FHS9_HYAAZ|nr:uncharacterized protein LOC108677582 isoform X2 [Hyalella azteca]